jgi:hypothetical protein
VVGFDWLSWVRLLCMRVSGEVKCIDVQRIVSTYMCEGWMRIDGLDAISK